MSIPIQRNLVAISSAASPELPLPADINTFCHPEFFHDPFDLCLVQQIVDFIQQALIRV